MKRFRLVVLSAVWLGVAFFSLDRVNISLAAPEIMRELGISGVEMGMVLSLYFWGYLLGNPLGGLVADNFNLRRFTTAIMGSWCAFTALTKAGPSHLAPDPGQAPGVRGWKGAGLAWKKTRIIEEKGYEMGPKKILWADPELCVGCQMCELMCSLQKTGTFNPYRARIKVTKRPEEGLNYPVFCRHCQKARCQTACPEGALERDLQTGAVVLSEAQCIGCGACAAACPFGAIQVGPQGETLKCDLCGGDPTCVQFCSKRPENTSPLRPNPEGATALKFLPPHQVTLAKRMALVKQRI